MLSSHRVQLISIRAFLLVETSLQEHAQSIPTAACQRYDQEMALRLLPFCGGLSTSYPCLSVSISLSVSLISIHISKYIPRLSMWLLDLIRLLDSSIKIRRCSSDIIISPDRLREIEPHLFATLQSQRRLPDNESATARSPGPSFREPRSHAMTSGTDAHVRSQCQTLYLAGCESSKSSIRFSDDRSMSLAFLGLRPITRACCSTMANLSTSIGSPIRAYVPSADSYRTPTGFLVGSSPMIILLRIVRPQS